MASPNALPRSAPSTEPLRTLSELVGLTKLLPTPGKIIINLVFLACWSLITFTPSRDGFGDLQPKREIYIARGCYGSPCVMRIVYTNSNFTIF
jgi:hypothetical protein